MHDAKKVSRTRAGVSRRKALKSSAPRESPPPARRCFGGRRRARASAGRAQEGEAHLLELGGQPGAPEDLDRLGRDVQQVAELHRGRGRRDDGGDGVAQEARHLVRGRRGARRRDDGAVLGAGLLRQRHPPSHRGILQQVGCALGLPAQRHRAGALQAGPADPVRAADQHSLLPVLPRRLARRGEAEAARHLRRVHHGLPRHQQAAGSLRHRDARADLLGDPGDPARSGRAPASSSSTRRATSTSTRPRRSA